MKFGFQVGLEGQPTNKRLNTFILLMQLIHWFVCVCECVSM